MDLIGFGYAALVTIGSVLGYKRRGKPRHSFPFVHLYLPSSLTPFLPDTVSPVAQGSLKLSSALPSAGTIGGHHHILCKSVKGTEWKVGVGAGM